MSSTDIHSVVSIYGIVQAVDRRYPNEKNSEQCQCRFAVENEDGRFSVQASLPSESCDQLSASQVQVIGTLSSSCFRQCHCHHQRIEALSVIIRGLDDERTG